MEELIWIDTHAHLYLDAIEQDRKGIVERLKMAGIKKVVLPNIDLDTIPRMMNWVEEDPQLFFPCIGLHPCDVKGNWKSALTQMETHLHDPRIIAIGETGLDLYWDKSTLDEQIEALEWQIEWAKKTKKPIVLHARESTKELLDIIERHHNENLTGVFHCFSGDSDDVQRILALSGFYIGIGGSVTYKKNTLVDTLHLLKGKACVLETDSPFLPPVPHRGKRNESSYIPLIGTFLADSWQLPLNQVASITTENASRLFGFTTE